MNPGHLQQCSIDSFTEKTTFPELLQRLASDGVRWYLANLVLGATTYYAEGPEAHREKWPVLEPGRAIPAATFDENGVVAAIRASQKKEIGYPEFLRRIAAAGVALYTVHIKGRKAIYWGADGDFHIEPFPQ